jgi:hypothetical protein
MAFRNPDGSYNHFEMKGGPFQGWVEEVTTLAQRISGARDVFANLEIGDVDGTKLVWSLLDSFSHRLERLEEVMKTYREKECK